MKKISFLLLFICGAIAAQAQIAYQMTLHNTITGEIRANETVRVGVSLSNREGDVFCSETMYVTTDNFGILSLTVGDADTFKNVDFSKMPFYISVSVDGVMIGKSQLLNVPVAEVAKTLAPISVEEIVGTWCDQDTEFYVDFKYTFKRNYTVTATHTIYTGTKDEKIEEYSGQYFIYGNFITVILNNGRFSFFQKHKNLMMGMDGFYDRMYVYKREY